MIIVESFDLHRRVQLVEYYRKIILTHLDHFRTSIPTPPGWFHRVSFHLMYFNRICEPATLSLLPWTKFNFYNGKVTNTSIKNQHVWYLFSLEKELKPENNGLFGLSCCSSLTSHCVGSRCESGVMIWFSIALIILFKRCCFKNIFHELNWNYVSL